MNSSSNNASGKCNESEGPDNTQVIGLDQDGYQAEGKIDRPSDSLIRSRNLSETQLSDVAWNVRTLSRKLRRLRLRLTVRHVVLVAKVKDRTVIEHTREVAEWLLSMKRDVPYVVYVQDQFKDNQYFKTDELLENEPSAHGRLKFWHPDSVRNSQHLFDFVIALGGDGTILYTNWLFQCVVPPVLSFSLGSLGFLTKFNFDTYQSTITAALREGVIVSLWLRFECTIMRANDSFKPRRDRDLIEELVGVGSNAVHTHSPDKSFGILNDVVIDRGPNPSMFCNTYIHDI